MGSPSPTNPPDEPLSRHGTRGVAPADGARVLADEAPHHDPAGHDTGHVAGDDGAAVVPCEPTGPVIAGHADVRMAASDGAAVPADQPADMVGAALVRVGIDGGGRHATGRVAAHDGAPLLYPSQAANIGTARYIDVNHPHVSDCAGRPDDTEQADEPAVAPDEQIGDGMPVAFEDRPEHRIFVVDDIRTRSNQTGEVVAPDRHPARAVVPIRVSGV